MSVGCKTLALIFKLRSSYEKIASWLKKLGISLPVPKAAMGTNQYSDTIGATSRCFSNWKKICIKVRNVKVCNKGGVTIKFKRGGHSTTLVNNEPGPAAKCGNVEMDETCRDAITKLAKVVNIMKCVCGPWNPKFRNFMEGVTESENEVA
jgi:hypothetical protein